MERGWDTGGVHGSAKSRMTRRLEERLKRGQRRTSFVKQKKGEEKTSEANARKEEDC